MLNQVCECSETTLECTERHALKRKQARNFRTWQYAPADRELPRTSAMIAAAIDVRLPLQFEDEDFDQMARVLLAAVDDAMAEA